MRDAIFTSVRICVHKQSSYNLWKHRQWHCSIICSIQSNILRYTCLLKLSMFHISRWASVRSSTFKSSISLSSCWRSSRNSWVRLWRVITPWICERKDQFVLFTPFVNGCVANGYTIKCIIELDSNYNEQLE